MSKVDDWEDARRLADRFQWVVIAVLTAIAIGGFGAWVAYDNHQKASETCTERKVREAKELGIPMYYDSRTGFAPGCND